MSDVPPRIGLSNSKLDADLQNNEIDHDFFDNPCASIESDDDISAGESCKIQSESRAAAALSLHKGQMEPKRRPASADLRLNIDKSLAPIIGSDFLVTPDTCVSSPNNLPPPTRRIFSTGQLLDCLMDGEEKRESGQHSSWFDWVNEATSRPATDEQAQEGGGVVQEGGRQLRGKLFDLSSTSSSSDSDSSDSESEKGLEDEEGILDTEDEEFVNLLQKYYDYIDLGDSETSDLTQISPMSSFTASPLPPFGLPNEKYSDHADPVYKTDDNRAGYLDRFQRSSTKSPQSKPLPPLIIHTLEEISIIRPQPARFAQQGFHVQQVSNPFPASLLMKVGEEGKDRKEKAQEAPFSKEITSTVENFENKQSSTSSMSTSSSSSLQSKNDTASSLQTESAASASSCSSYASNKIKHNTNEQFRRKGTNSNKNHHHHGPLAHVKASIHHHRFGYNHQPKASATIARQRQQRRIDHENSILVRRLQTVKPSKEIIEAFRMAN